MGPDAPLVEIRDIHKNFGPVLAVQGISMTVRRGEVMCLLGDNGAGKSTLIKILSGSTRPSRGEYFVEGEKREFVSPRQALEAGIATVYQDLAMVPLMSVSRNFFMGREPTRGIGLFRRFDADLADRVAREEMARIGIDIRDPQQAVGTLSGGERQCVAIARAVYFGAKVLILDEPTSALGVKQTDMVLKYIDQVNRKGLGVIFITHNARHAHAVGNRFTVLSRGRTIGTYSKSEIKVEELQNLMAGASEIQALAARLGVAV